MWGLKGKIEKSTIIVGDVNTARLVIDWSDMQKISKGIFDLNSTIHQLDIIDIYRILHPPATEHAFFPSSYGTFTKIDHFLGHKTHIKKFKRIKSIQRIFSDHNGLKSEINNRKIAKIPHTFGDEKNYTSQPSEI